jgi:hypothetical protein
MMLPMSPGDLDRMVKDRQDELRASQRPSTGRRPGLRVHLGRALIAAGAALSGEQVERPARRSTSLRRATGPTG